MLKFKGSWDEHSPLIDFSNNNIFHASIGMAPFEVLYARRCRSPIGWFNIGKVALIGSDMVMNAMEKINSIREKLQTAQSQQNSYSDVRKKGTGFPN